MILNKKRPTAAQAHCLAAWIIGLILVAAVPAAATPSESSGELERELERLEEGIAFWEGPAPTSDVNLQLLRDVRYLRHLARLSKAGREIMLRIGRLEHQIRTGRFQTPPTRGNKTGDLDKTGTISGKVTRASDGAPLGGVIVELWDLSFGSFRSQSVFTEANGNYTLEAVEPGEYTLAVDELSGEYLEEIFDNIPCQGGVNEGCLASDGTPFTVVDGSSIQANFALDIGGSISGTIINGASGEPLASISVRLFSETGGSYSRLGGFTDASGHYQITGLESGTFLVGTEDFSGVHLEELYDDVACPGGPDDNRCDVTDGMPISVQVGEETTDIDFDLDKFGAISGRVIDALSGDPIPSIWMTAYTFLGVRISDTRTDEMGRYTLGGLRSNHHYVIASDSFGFTNQLYEGIPCMGCDPTTGTPIPVELNETTEGIDFSLEGGCLESATVMCLNRNRFRVEARWRTSSGNEGLGQVEELTSDSGYFWFFGPDNIEMVVKVLDACTLPGANKFWVFAGGLTDVEVTLTITDTQNGTVRTYTNTLGTPFQPIQDTSAFDTCP